MIKKLCWLIVAICTISMLHGIAYAIWPGSGSEDEATRLKYDARDWFIVPRSFEVNMLYWIKYLGDILKWVIVYYVLAQIAKVYNRKLFYIACLMCLKSITYFLTFIYNFSQSQWVQWISYGVTVGVITIIFLPIKEKTNGAIVKSIE